MTPAVAGESVGRIMERPCDEVGGGEGPEGDSGPSRTFETTGECRLETVQAGELPLADVGTFSHIIGAPPPQPYGDYKDTRTD